MNIQAPHPGAAALTDLASATADAGGNASQYVTFHIDDGIFAVPLAEVQEIIRVPDVVKVPLSPPSLEGLANLRGTVMSITSLRRIFRYPDLGHDDATRVVVINQGVPVGLVVDRMSAVVTADADQIETVAAIEATIDTDLLRGLIKAGDGRGMIMILDPARLVASEFGATNIASGHAMTAESTHSEEVESTPTATAQDELQLVSFVVAEQEYALGIESVQEIVQMPERIGRVPRTQSHVLGVVTLRNRLLPLVSLREMFGLPTAPLDERNKIVVVPLPDKTSVGIVMDMVREVLRVNRNLLDPVPSLLRGATRQNEIQGICRLAGGKRLVSVLSAEALFENEAVRRAVAGGADAEEGEAMTAQDQLRDAGVLEDEEQFVVFRLANEEYGAPIAAVQEIVRVPEELTRLPKAPAFIRGVVNLRGSVLPVVDQRTRFDLEDIERNDRQRIMVFTIEGIRTGFIVDQVTEVLKIPRGAIGPTPALSAEQARLISRVANLEKQRRMILLIDVDHLLAPNEIGAVRSEAGVAVH
ncbi:purine-binding chemotaxis protein CheW [Roseomonas frigidaquae]|uniref:Chemotaxis protein CheW n=1 Tax=Falsiroseomonas frigidaquae TaxID=487318 RepID=A0ABX1F1W5_9PROT|nr:chemotaxis protein CheW [Falsiroseomonas frigidaquae]NKE46297.1 purine-binding chemotaxis protein CheW [Falsiroseomonas frigidaquae]